MKNTLPSFITTKTGIVVTDRVMKENFPGHSHDFYEIEYIISGKGCISINDVQYPIKENTLFFFTPLDFEKIELDGDVKLLNIAFSPEWINESIANELTSYTVIEDYIFPYAERICDEYRKNKRFNQTIIENMLTIMLVDISRNIREDEIKSGNRYDKNIRKAINYMHLHFKNNIDLNEVAKITYLSPAYFSTTFKKSTNLSFLQYLTDLRLTYAKRLLINTKMSITDICYNSGFSSFSNFSRLFKEKFNTTPRLYRELNSNTSTQFHEPIDYKIE